MKAAALAVAPAAPAPELTEAELRDVYGVVDEKATAARQELTAAKAELARAEGDPGVDASGYASIARRVRLAGFAVEKLDGERARAGSVVSKCVRAREDAEFSAQVAAAKARLSRAWNEFSPAVAVLEKVVSEWFDASAALRSVEADMLRRAAQPVPWASPYAVSDSIRATIDKYLEARKNEAERASFAFLLRVPPC